MGMFELLTILDQVNDGEDRAEIDVHIDDIVF
jgi:hypothetical protein